jgi:hypothetical protein
MTTYLDKMANEMGLRRVSARKSLDITVTKKDTVRGVVKDPECCALALACRRVDPDVKAAYFFKTTAWLQYERKLVCYALPLVLQKEIVSFDRSGIMAPGAYSLSPSVSRKVANGRRRFTRGRYIPRSQRKNVKRMTTMVRKLERSAS